MATANKALNQPVYNSSNWDVPLNTNFGYIDSAFGGTATISNSTTYTLTTSQYQCMRLLLNGSLSSNISIRIPSGVGGMWLVTNNTTDLSLAVPCYVTIATTAGGSVGVDAPRGSTVSVFSDGTNIYYANSFVQPGAIEAYAGTVAPSGYLFCNGAAVSRSTYSALFARVGTTWGAGNGTTTFNLPDFQNMFLRGSGTSAVGTYEADSFSSHTHSDSGHTHNSTYDLVVTNSSAFNIGTTAGGSGLQAVLKSAYLTTTGYANIQATGGTETRPINKRVLYIIKT